jgi:hypothetical protein
VDINKYMATDKPEGKRFWEAFHSEMNSKGKEITQKKSVIEARATGDKR